MKAAPDARTHAARPEDLPAWIDTLPTLFIVGCPRSGTTWIQRMLLSLDGVVGGEESHFFAAFAPALRSYDAAAAAPRRVGLCRYIEREDFLREMRRLWGVLQAPLVEASEAPQLLVEKTPGHVRYAAEIDTLFPRSHFLHVVRDGRAVAASLMAASRGWGRTWAPKRIGGAARMWKDHVEAGLAIRAQVGDERYLELRYEDLQVDAAGRLRAVARFAGLDPGDEAIENAVQRNEAAVVRAGDGEASWADEPAGFLRQAEPDAWRAELNAWQRWKFRFYAGDLLGRLGYR